MYMKYCPSTSWVEGTFTEETGSLNHREPPEVAVASSGTVISLLIGCEGGRKEAMA